MVEAKPDDHADDAVDDEIRSCLDLEAPRSFFLYAGAGSGKTRSLVNAIDFLRSAKKDPTEKNRRWLQERGKRVAVITFTKAARDEIVDRTQQDPLIVVHTIHSFSWLLIRDHQSDIRSWLRSDLAKSIAEMEVAQASRTRTDTKIYQDTQRSILGKRTRLELVDDILEFTYSPAGNNNSKESLNHGEVLKIVSSFLNEKPTIQRILVDAFPVLLVDESQDTNRHLLEALINVQSNHSKEFSLGLLGDTMQKIYADGHPDLGKDDFVPTTWAKPEKTINHRSRARIIELANRVRSEVDTHKQDARSDRGGGFVRLFIVDRSKNVEPLAVEEAARKRMAEITEDRGWITDDQNEETSVKTLILEHHMAATRLGFSELFEPLYKVSNENFRTSLLEGTLPGLRFFCVDVAELVDAIARRDEFAIARIVQEKSPLLDVQNLKHAGNNQKEVVNDANSAVSDLKRLLNEQADPPLNEMLDVIAARKLFEIPRSLEPFVEREKKENDDQHSDVEDELQTEIGAWRAALNAQFSQAKRYHAYVTGDTGFDTHQGVKGLEFPRVMIVVNDEEARGFLFSYDKIFGAKEKSKRDLENEAAGNDSGPSRTRRLLYVTVSRAEESLVVVAYTDNVQVVKDTAINNGLFTAEEVEELG